MYGGMRAIGEELKVHAREVLGEWEELVREQPWFSLPLEHRINSLPEVLAALADAALCNPGSLPAHRQALEAAALHGENRRQQGIPEHLILTEYHLLRQAIWYWLSARLGASDVTRAAIMRIDPAISMATNASMWGYYRVEVEGMGKWEEAMARILEYAPPARRDG
jgi:hypothetical protein